MHLGCRRSRAGCRHLPARGSPEFALSSFPRTWESEFLFRLLLDPACTGMTALSTQDPQEIVLNPRVHGDDCKNIRIVISPLLRPENGGRRRHEAGQIRQIRRHDQCVAFLRQIGERRDILFGDFQIHRVDSAW